MDAFRPLLIAGLVVTEVAIWQWRMVIAHRGRRVSAMLLTIITKAPNLAQNLWDRGWPVTVQSGHTENGPVTILSVPVSRRDEARLQHDVQSITSDVAWTTKDLRAPHPAGWSRLCTPA